MKAQIYTIKLQAKDIGITSNWDGHLPVSATINTDHPALLGLLMDQVDNGIIDIDDLLSIIEGRIYTCDAEGLRNLLPQARLQQLINAYTSVSDDSEVLP